MLSIKTLAKNLFRSLGLEIKRYKPPSRQWIYDLKIEAVLDVGANTGQFATFINKVLPDVKIYSFEPIKGCYDELLVNCKSLNLQPYNVALGDANYESEINVSSHSPSSSLLQMNNLHKNVFEHTQDHTVEAITVKRLDDIDSEIHFPANLLLKIDVQGFEDKVIKGAVSTLKKTSIVWIEMSYQELYKGQPLFDDIYKLLRENRFVFYGNVSQVFNPADGKILYSDSIFLKEESNK